MSKKLAEEWAENILNSEEGLKAKEQFEKDFLDSVIFGEQRIKVTTVLNKKEHWVGHKIEGVEEPIIQFLTVKEIIENYSDYLTEEELENLRNYICKLIRV